MKFKLLFIICLFFSKSNAQYLQSSVISSGGDNYKQIYASMNWTIGEVASESFLAGDYFFNQGFQQGQFGGLNSIEEQVSEGKIFALYPNPSSDIIHLKFIIPNVSRKFKVKVFNMLGQLNFEDDFSNGDISFEISAFPSGFYIVEVLDENGNEFYGKFQKN